MSKIIKIISNELIEIKDLRNPRVCFNNEEYDDVENYCIYKEVINPFQIMVEYNNLQQENEQLKEELQKANDTLDTHQELINYLQDRINKAIEYLEQEPVIEINGAFRNIYSEDDDKLLKILKGDSDE